MIRLELPYPPSVNHIYTHTVRGVFLKPEVKAYRWIISGILRRDKIQTAKGRLKIEVDLYPPDRRIRDLDNILKSLLDALKIGKAYEDDSQIDDLHVRRREMMTNGLTIIQLEVIGDGEENQKDETRIQSQNNRAPRKPQQKRVARRKGGSTPNIESA